VFCYPPDVIEAVDLGECTETAHLERHGRTIWQMGDRGSAVAGHGGALQIGDRDEEAESMIVTTADGTGERS
jgi:hypothetical protein